MGEHNRLKERKNYEFIDVSSSDANQIKMHHGENKDIIIDIPDGYKAHITFEIDDSSNLDNSNKTLNEKYINNGNNIFDEGTASDIIYLEERRKDKNFQSDDDISKLINSEEKYMKGQKLENKFKNSALVFPIVEFNQIKDCWNNFIEIRTFKAFFVLAGSILTLLFGSFTILSWALLVMAVLHFILRNIANKYKSQNDYINISKSTQLFLWPFILLAVGNVLSKIISFDGLPEGTFFSLYTLWLIYGELKGFTDNAKVAQMPIPPILERLVYGNKNDSDKEIPF